MARVLIACEFSGVVRDAFRERGHDAVSCDLLPTVRPGPHIQGDALKHLDKGWDLLIAHPPCTFLANSSVRWLEEISRWGKMDEAAAFFRQFLDAPVPRIAVENPIMHGYGLRAIGRGKDFSVHPWQFGDPFRKSTCFWTVGLPALKTISGTTNKEALNAKDNTRLHHESWRYKGLSRGLRRSVTYSGIARAMAEQWGGLL